MALNKDLLGQEIFNTLNHPKEKNINLEKVCADLANVIINHFIQNAIVSTTVNTVVSTPQGAGKGVGTGVGNLS